MSLAAIAGGWRKLSSVGGFGQGLKNEKTQPCVQLRQELGCLVVRPLYGYRVVAK